MVAPEAFLFAFHSSLKTYVLPAVTTNKACTKAALGEKAPAYPPLSFHATSWSAPPFTLTKIARSWLKPALAVHRSAPPPSTTRPLVLGAKLSTRFVPSTNTHVPPLLFARWYCCVLTAFSVLAL